MTQTASKKWIKTLFGRFSGYRHQGLLSDRQRLYSDGGFASGIIGSENRYPGPQYSSFFEDFDGAVGSLPARFTALEGTDSATSAEVIASGIGGTLVMTTGDAGTGAAADACQIVTGLHYRAANGGLAFETRIKMSAITTCQCFVGFTDSLSLEVPFISTSSGNTIGSQATDAVGFMFDTRMTDDTWWMVGVANDVDTTPVNTALAPVADTYAVLRVEVSSTGVATFYYNGAVVGTQSGALTTTVALTPTIAVSKTSVAASMTLTCDYLHAGCNRLVSDGGSI